MHNIDIWCPCREARRVISIKSWMHFSFSSSYSPSRSASPSSRSRSSRSRRPSTQHTKLLLGPSVHLWLQSSLGSLFRLMLLLWHLGGAFRMCDIIFKIVSSTLHSESWEESFLWELKPKMHSNCNHLKIWTTKLTTLASCQL